MLDYPPIESGVEQLLYNLYAWLGEPSHDVVRYMQELDLTALNQSTYQLTQTRCSDSRSQIDVEFKRSDLAVEILYPRLLLNIYYTSPTRWTGTLTCGDVQVVYFSRFLTLHDAFKLFFNKKLKLQQLEDVKPTPASRRIVEL